MDPYKKDILKMRVQKEKAKRKKSLIDKNSPQIFRTLTSISFVEPTDKIGLE